MILLMRDDVVEGCGRVEQVRAGNSLCRESTGRGSVLDDVQWDSPNECGWLSMDL